MSLGMVSKSSLRSTMRDTGWCMPNKALRSSDVGTCRSDKSKCIRLHVGFSPRVFIIEWHDKLRNQDKVSSDNLLHPRRDDNCKEN